MAGYGIVQIGNQTFIERFKVFSTIVNVTSNGQIQPSLSLALPAVANFWLKGLSRVIIKANAEVTNGSCPFMFRFGNSDGNIWYNSGGTGGTSDYTIDSNIFGSAKFPYPIIPHALFYLNGSIPFQVQDISNNASYDIHIGFHGSYLLPAN